VLNKNAVTGVVLLSYLFLRAADNEPAATWFPVVQPQDEMAPALVSWYRGDASPLRFF